MAYQLPNKVPSYKKGSSFGASGKDDVVITMDGAIINASGHRDQLQRHYGLLSICGMALTSKIIVRASKSVHPSDVDPKSTTPGLQ